MRIKYKSLYLKKQNEVDDLKYEIELYKKTLNKIKSGAVLTEYEDTTRPSKYDFGKERIIWVKFNDDEKICLMRKIEENE